jgi:hypothetical protein
MVVQLLGYLCYVQFINGARRCFLTQMSTTSGFFVSGWISVAQLYYYICLWEREKQKTKLHKLTCQYFEATDVTKKELVYKPTLVDRFFDSWLYAVFVAGLCFGLLVSLLIYVAEISPLESDKCIFVAHPTIAMVSFASNIIVMSIQFYIIYSHREVLSPFSRFYEINLVLLLSVLANVFNIALVMTFPILVNMSSAMLTSAFDYTPFTFGSMVIEGYYALDMFINIVFPVLYDYMRQRWSIATKTLKDQFERNEKTPTVLNLLLSYARESYQTDIITIWYLLERMNETSIKLDEMAEMTIKLAQHRGVKKILGEELEANDLRYASDRSRVTKYVKETYILPLFVLMSRQTEFDMLLTKTMLINDE